ncbi:unnamed protein product [Ectocarpus sp. 12 AP-2014]
MRLQQKTALQKVSVLVKAGMMEPPKWYAAAKQVPPFQRRPSNGIEALKLPWDTLANEFASRNPHMVEDPEWLGPRGFRPGAPPISHVFAKRQYALMQNGLMKEDAYERTHELMKMERSADVAAVQKMVREASSMAGGRPSFVSDEDVYSGLKFWQSMMQETSYSEWDLAAKQGLDAFLRRELIGWDDDHLKLAQSARDGTSAALEAEINRLRVTLFPETKTTEYAYPSDVVRPRGEADEDVEEELDDDVEDEEGVEGEEALARDGTEEWISARLNCSWSATLRRFEEMTEEVGYELDWSVEDRRSLDNFLVGRCIRRSVLDEAFTWLPDPVAEALAKVNASMLASPPPTSSSTTEEAAAAEGEGTGDEDKDGERWVSGPELEAFTGDWMSLARKRTGRTPTGVSAAAAAEGAGRGRGRRGVARDVEAVVGRPSMALQSNLRAVLTQAKRQLLPDLVLEVDEKAGPVSAEERRAKDAARQKIVMSALEWEKEEIDEQRKTVTDKLRAGLTAEQADPIEAVRKKRLAKGTWKAERRRLLNLEKKLYYEKQAGLEHDEGPATAIPELVDDVVESEAVRRKADEFYAKEKARIKKEIKLQAEAAAIAAAAKAK